MLLGCRTSHPASPSPTLNACLRPAPQILQQGSLIKMLGMYVLLVPMAYGACCVLVAITKREFQKSMLLSYAALVKLPGAPRARRSAHGLTI